MGEYGKEGEDMYTFGDDIDIRMLQMYDDTKYITGGR